MRPPHPSARRQGHAAPSPAESKPRTPRELRYRPDAVERCGARIHRGVPSRVAAARRRPGDVQIAALADPDLVTVSIGTRADRG